MQSDSGIIYHLPPKPLWVPRHHATKPTGLGVRFRTEICDVDSKGTITKATPGQSGWNTITDWGMDSIASAGQAGLVNYLHLSDTLGPAKRVLTGGVTLTLTITDASNIAVAASAGFFLAGDVGNTLSIDDLGGSGITQELKITAYTDSQNVTCSTRAGVWLPGVTAGTGPFTSAGVHFTSVNTLANQTQKFNTYDTAASNYSAELNDSGNGRFIHQRIFLSAAVTGTAWTVNQLGWSNGNVSNYVFGKVNLTSADTVPVGKKYRVTLQFYSAYTPISIASQSIDWGATIGTYDLKFLQERIGYDSSGSTYDGHESIAWLNFLRPVSPGSLDDTGFANSFNTSAQTPQSVLWSGDAGFTPLIHTYTNAGSNAQKNVSDGAYTGGTHTKARTVKWDDTIAITAAQWLGVGVRATYSGENFYGSCLSIFPNSGTITKPSGYWAALTFNLYWTRAFAN